jgi:hypothetical protein
MTDHSSLPPNIAAGIAADPSRMYQRLVTEARTKYWDMPERQFARLAGMARSHYHKFAAGQFARVNHATHLRLVRLLSNGLPPRYPPFPPVYIAALHAAHYTAKRKPRRRIGDQVRSRTKPQ